jgi:dinuclear metal center YbgI/SA1388 family protein
VDASAATIRLAVARQVDFLLVHHGLFWGGLRPLTGPLYARLAPLMAHNVAVYGAHLPLDCHPEVGNAVVLAGRLGVAVRGEFGSWQGQVVGVWGELDAAREEFTDTVARALGAAPRVLPFGPERVRRVGIATGGGGSLIGQAHAARLDTFVTGEGAHYTYFDAEELRLNVYYGGHYLTETFGVKALAEHLERKFGLAWTFIDHPTGM